MKIRDRFTNWLDSAPVGLIVLLFVLCVIGPIGIWMIFEMASSHKKDYIKAPIESCSQSKTGARKSDTIVAYYQCASYDAKGQCTVNVPIYQDVTYEEVRVICDWKEWR